MTSEMVLCFLLFFVSLIVWASLLELSFCGVKRKCILDLTTIVVLDDVGHLALMLELLARVETFLGSLVSTPSIDILIILIIANIRHLSISLSNTALPFSSLVENVVRWSLLKSRDVVLNLVELGSLFSQEFGIIIDVLSVIFDHVWLDDIIGSTQEGWLDLEIFSGGSLKNLVNVVVLGECNRMVQLDLSFVFQISLGSNEIIFDDIFTSSTNLCLVEPFSDIFECVLAGDVVDQEYANGTSGVLLFDVICSESLASGSVPDDNFVNVITNLEIKISLVDALCWVVLDLEFSIHDSV